MVRASYLASVWEEMLQIHSEADANLYLLTNKYSDLGKTGKKHQPVELFQEGREKAGEQ